MGTKSSPELNSKFGTDVKPTQPSKMMEGISRGIKEVKKLVGDEVYVYMTMLIKSLYSLGKEETKRS